jgi:hypothetical protein
MLEIIIYESLFERDKIFLDALSHCTIMCLFKLYIYEGGNNEIYYACFIINISLF